MSAKKGTWCNENDFIFVFHRIMMTNIKNHILHLCIRIDKTKAITVYGVGRNDRGEFGIPGQQNFMQFAFYVLSSIYFSIVCVSV